MIKPLGNRVVLQKIEEELKKGSLILTKEKIHLKYKVISCGEKVTEVKVGDIVLCNKNYMTAVYDLFISNVDEILGILDGQAD